MAAGNWGARLAPYAIANVAAVGLLGFVLLAAKATDREFATFTRDPLAGSGEPIYTGFVSSVGVLVWWSGAVACLLAAWTLRGRPPFRPLLAAGAFTAWLALDDLFQVHEEAIPTATGISEKVVYAAYALLFVVFLVLFRPLLDRDRLTVLGVAAAFFALSIGSDAAAIAFDLDDGALLHLIEDGGKLLGIVTWTMLLVITSLSVSRATEPGRPETVAA